MTADSLLEIEQAAVRLLSNREHTTKQLKSKLLDRQFDYDAVDNILETLQRQNLLSDERFAAEYIGQRRRKGYGPVRIQHEMREKGVPDKFINEYLDVSDPQWMDDMEKALEKKFGLAPVLNFTERARRARFLEYRGFASHMIREKLFTDD